jgi:RNA polymerase sigma-70 factor (ECF subfamily)
LTDSEIIDLYLKRSESAISETAKQYGSYCQAIAMNILHNQQDAEEVVNDTYLSLWNLIPPEHPDPFLTYIGRITRNLSIKKCKARTAQKRGGSETILLLSELDLCLPSTFNVEDKVDINNLSQEINSFLSTIKREDKLFFIGRYWFTYSVPEIASQFSVGESKIKMSLHRTRKKLKTYLEKRGIIV